MRLVALTFAGRECSMRILFNYILKYRKYIDEYRIYVATTIQSDLDYMRNFANSNDFVKLIYTYCDEINNIILDDKNKIWDYAYKTCQEDDTVYLKMDDDIVYMDEKLFTDFIDYRIQNREAPLLFPCIINNLFISCFLQDSGAYIPVLKSNIKNTWTNTHNRIKDYIINNKDKKIRIGDITNDGEVLCKVSWGNVKYCIDLHNQFITDAENMNTKKYEIPNIKLEHAEPVSINVCSWIGSDLKQITAEYGDVYYDEPWWTIYLPTWSGRCNEIYGGAIVSHYAYYRQRELGLDRTDILNKYNNLAVNPPQTLGAFIQCYKSPYATFKAIESFRRFYPNSSIVMVSDNGHDYSEMAKYFNCKYIHCDENLFLIYNDLTTGKHIEWGHKILNRVENAFSQVNEDYILWLEDDVLVNRKIRDIFLFDMNGNCCNKFLPPMLSAFKTKYDFISETADYRFTGGGGSVYNKNKILQHLANKDLITDILTNWVNYNMCSNIVVDILISTVTLLNRGYIGPYRFIADGFNVVNNSLDVQHQYKVYYNMPMPNNLKYLVNEK